MDSFLPKWIDAIFRKHPTILLLCVAGLAIAACLTMLASGHSRLVYEGF